MLRSVIRFSLRFPWLVVALAVGLVAVGFVQFSNARKDLLPEFTPVTVEVQTEALGLSAYEVEQLITVPLEQDLLNGIAFLDEIESASLPGLSSVVMTFEPGTDVLDARQVVAERVTQAVAVAGLPNVASKPQMIQPLSSTSRVALVSLSSDEMTPIEQSVEARWVIVPALLGVDGVANVSIFGFRDRQLQVIADPEVLGQQQLDLSDVIRTAGNSLEVSPLTFLEASKPGTGGFIDTANQRLHVFHEQTITSAEELAQVPIEGDEGEAVQVNGAPLLLGDVTEIVEDHQPLIGDARCEDGPCLLLVVEKFPDANTPEVAANVAATLDTLKPGLPDLAMDTSIYEPASFIDDSLMNMGVVFLIGALLMVIIIGLVFRDWRTTLIGAVTIVVSVAGAVLVLLAFDVTVNTMVLAGLVMALVIIVDEGVTGAGLIAQHVSEKRLEGNGATVPRAVMNAALENGRPALYSLAISIAILLPFFVMGGVVGAFFPTVAAAYLAAVVVALLVSMMVAPALGILLLKRAGGLKESGFGVGIQSSYRERAASRTSIFAPMITLAVLLVIGLVSIPFLEARMRPSLQERDVVVSLTGPPGMSLPRMEEVTTGVVEEIRALPGIDNVAAHVGRAITSDQVVDVNASEIWVSIDGSADYNKTVDAVEVVTSGYPEVAGDVSTYSEQRVNEVLGQSSDEVVVRVYGEDNETLASTAEDIQGVVANVDGVDEATVVTELQQDTIEVEVDLEAAQAHGLKPGDIRRTAAILVSGITVGNLFEEQKVFDVIVWGPSQLRETPEAVGNLLITTPAGAQIPLSEVADVRVVPSATVIRHESVSKYVDVIATSNNDSLGAVANRIEGALDDYTFPAEFHAAVLGGFVEDNATRVTVISVAIAGLIAIYLLFQSAFASWRLATLAMLLLPMALTGSMIAIWIFSREFTLGVVAGMIAVVALASRWILELVRRYQRLQREGVAFGPELVASGTSDRLLPILASGLAIIGFFIPALIRSGGAGLEIVAPLGFAVVGGVLTTLALALFVFPAAFTRWGKVEHLDTSTDELFVDYDREPERV